MTYFLPAEIRQQTEMLLASADIKKNSATTAKAYRYRRETTDIDIGGRQSRRAKEGKGDKRCIGKKKKGGEESIVKRPKSRRGIARTLGKR